MRRRSKKELASTSSTKCITHSQTLSPTKSPIKKQQLKLEKVDIKMQVIIENNTGFPNENVFITIKGKTKGGWPCFVDLGHNQSSLVITHSDMMTMQYGYSLLALSGCNGGEVKIQIPQIKSGHIFFSLGRPLNFELDESLKIKHINPEDFNNLNYYTLYDQIKITYDKSGSWIRPTALEFFSLPIFLSQKELATKYDNNNMPLTEVGFSASRGEILQLIEHAFNGSNAWWKLISKYQDITFRVMSPSKGMFFPKDYLNKFVDTIWNHYSKEGNMLSIDCHKVQQFEPEFTEYIFTGRIESNAFVFRNFSEEVGARLEKTEACSLFEWTSNTSIFSQNTTKAVIARYLTIAFEVGFLPLLDNNAVLSKKYFKKYQNLFYKFNGSEDANNPWYNLYSKVLHEANLGTKIATCAYDILSMQTTLHDPDYKNVAPLTISLGNVDLQTLPSPYKNHHYKKVTIIFQGVQTNSDLTVEYSKEDVFNELERHEFIALYDVTTPIKLKFNGVVQHIYTKPNIIEPIQKGVTECIAIQTDICGELTIVFEFPLSEEYPMTELVG
ncbi:MAG: beta-1,3-glucanase family protein [Rickettsiaceae bacterium]